MCGFWPIMMLRSIAPTRGLELAALTCSLRRGRSAFHTLDARPAGGDPLPDPYAELMLEGDGPETEPEDPDTLPTPSDVPAQQPTDVPVPEPWDIPPPEPKDPRPKSVP